MTYQFEVIKKMYQTAESDDLISVKYNNCAVLYLIG